MHNQPEDHDVEVVTNQENPVPLTTAEEQDNVVKNINLENSLIQTAADEQEIMANMKDSECADVSLQVSNTNNEAYPALRSEERRVKAGEK